MTDENAERAEMAAKQRLREKAESYHEDLKEAFFNVLPGNQSPAETVFDAYMSGINRHAELSPLQRVAKVSETSNQLLSLP